MQPRETVQPLLAAAKRRTRRASDAAERTFGDRNGWASLSRGDGPFPGAAEGDNGTPFTHDETTRTPQLAKDEKDTNASLLKEDEAAPSIPSVEVDSATPLSQKDKTVERVNSLVQDIETVLLQRDENAADFYPPEQDNRATSSQTVVTVQAQRSIEDDSACEHKVFCVPRYWS